MTSIAYLDCFSGISGDMLLGAMLDAGLSLNALRTELQKLDVDGWSLHSEAVKRGGIAAMRAHVDLTEAAQPHRGLHDVLRIIEGSSLAAADKQRAGDVFRRLGEAEARIHGVSADEIEFHEVGAIDAIVDVVGGVVGLRLLGIDELYCSALPAGGGQVRGSHGV
ncbi:MAG TPA: nickel insertion protein, partial [Dehalococcoidia bacterium]